MLRVDEGVGEDEEAAIRVSDQGDLLQAERLADSFEVGYLGVHGLRRAGDEAFRRAVPRWS